VASETGSNKRWDEAVGKKLTGGDTLTGAKLHGDSFEFKPTHTLWFLCNHLPSFKDASHGFLRRVRVIPFRAKFEGKAIDPFLRMKLLAERDGIFGRLVDGARDYFRHGLGEVPDAINDATAEYIADNDVLGRFIAECTERVPRTRAGSQETIWSIANGAEARVKYPRMRSFLVGPWKKGALSKSGPVRVWSLNTLR
jgi:P4 family phage/plasmid primase-like protien